MEVQEDLLALQSTRVEKIRSSGGIRLREMRISQTFGLIKKGSSFDSMAWCSEREGWG